MATDTEQPPEENLTEANDAAQDAFDAWVESIGSKKLVDLTVSAAKSLLGE